MICYGVVTGRDVRGLVWQQEHYETKSGDARTRARNLRKLGLKNVWVHDMGMQVTSVGTVRMSMVEVRSVPPEIEIPRPERVERL